MKKRGFGLFFYVCTPKDAVHILALGGERMRKKKQSPLGLLMVGISVGIIVSIIIPDTLIILVLALILLLAGILFLR